MLRWKFIVLNYSHVKPTQCKSSRDGPTPMPSGSAVSEVVASPSRLEASHNLIKIMTPTRNCPQPQSFIAAMVYSQ